MKSNAMKAMFGVSAIVIGILALPVAAFVNTGLGLALLAVPVYLVYLAGG